MTGVGSAALRGESAERALLGNALTDPVLDTAGTLAVEASQPFSDLNASKQYRQSVLSRLVRQTVQASYDRATAPERNV